MTTREEKQKTIDDFEILRNYIESQMRAYMTEYPKASARDVIKKIDRMIRDMQHSIYCGE